MIKQPSMPPAKFEIQRAPIAQIAYSITSAISASFSFTANGNEVVKEYSDFLEMKLNNKQSTIRLPCQLIWTHSALLQGFQAIFIF